MNQNFNSIQYNVLLKEAEALTRMAESLDETFEKIIQCFINIEGRIIATGMGKSGHIAKKVAATLASTGSPAFFLHPAEAVHGDLGMITKNDAILAFSNSGNTTELLPIIDFAKRNDLPLVSVTKSKQSTLSKNATFTLLLPNLPEADQFNCVPTTSTIMQMAIGDAIAVTLMHIRGFNAYDFHKFHPGGSLGKKLLKVEEIMHTGAEMPLVSSDTPMTETLIVMTGKRFGVAGVMEGTKLVGIITDGDLRRHLHANLLQKNADDVMNPYPITVTRNILVSAALNLMETKKISALFITENQMPVGFFCIHDILRLGLN